MAFYFLAVDSSHRAVKSSFSFSRASDFSSGFLLRLQFCDTDNFLSPQSKLKFGMHYLFIYFILFSDFHLEKKKKKSSK